MARCTGATGLVEAQQRLRQMVLDTLPSPCIPAATTPRPSTTCSPFQLGRPLTRELLMAYRASIEKPLSASTINVRLSAVRKMVTEARRAGMLGVPRKPRTSPRFRTSGRREPGLGNWLTKEQAKELLAVPNRSDP